MAYFQEEEEDCPYYVPSKLQRTEKNSMVVKECTVEARNSFFKWSGQVTRITVTCNA